VGDTSASDLAAAAQAKSAARSALEGARLNESIEAGERSVELDPTDGEAWLILGAAYQQRGAWKDARRCYKACVDQGNRGPRTECAAMLR
jgi:Flp pilus assembly protein TadD